MFIGYNVMFSCMFIMGSDWIFFLMMDAYLLFIL